jgi:hypothetical protein
MNINECNNSLPIPNRRCKCNDTPVGDDSDSVDKSHNGLPCANILRSGDKRRVELGQNERKHYSAMSCLNSVHEHLEF